jgi:O-antigen/teichoic acid export membrane protein
MIFAAVFFLNAAANFALGVAISALLGPAEFGRYAAVALGASTLGMALFDWLRLSSIRFSASGERREATAASLEASYLAMIGVAIAAVGSFLALGIDFGMGPSLLWLTPLMAIAYARSDYCAAQMRARSQERAYAALAAIRQSLTFTVVLVIASETRSAGAVVAALTATTLLSIVALGPAMRTPGARLSQADGRMIGQFTAYAKPIVASSVIYLLITLIDRQLAFAWFGAAAAGELSLATDLGLRLFFAINFLPETLLFQYAVQREAEEGRAAAERQIAVNIVLSFAVLAPLTVGYMAMAPTFEALLVPAAFRGDYARLSLSVAPGLFAFCAIYSMCNPVFQLAGKTWPLTLAAVAALIANLALTRLPLFSADVDGLARAYAISFVIGLAVAGVLALRVRAIYPSLKDLVTVALATAAMGFAIRPLNAVHPPILAALLALALGGSILGGAMLAFDVGGCRAAVMRRPRAPTFRAGAQRLARGAKVG